MFHLKSTEIFSLLSAVKYTHKQPSTYDYSTVPRPCHNFLFMLEGYGEIQIDNEKLILNAGDVLFIPKGTTYVSVWKPAPIVVFHSIHFNFLPSVDPFLNTNIPIQTIQNINFDDIYRLVQTMDKTQYERNQNSFFAVSSFFEICGKLLQTVRYERIEKNFQPIQPAIDFLENNHVKKCTVEKLADLCFLSPSRFYYLFKELTGETPIHYKNRLTIQSAAQNLLSDKSVSVEEISEKYGFESAVYFRRLFKKLTGKTPSQYRKEEFLL